VIEQLTGAGQRAHLPDEPSIGLGVVLPETGSLFPRHGQPGLAEERVHQQAAAHADAPVDAPYGERDPLALERLAPGEHVLIDAVDQGPIEVEEERRGG
jgi:hypothetical protein